MLEAGLQADHVRLLKLQLCRILDGDNAFAVIDELAYGVQQRCFAEPVPPETRT